MDFLDLSDDVHFFYKYCFGKDIYLEWGTGSTTFLSTLMVRDKIYTIDSNARYQSRYIKKSKVLQEEVKSGKIISFNIGLHLDVGDNGCIVRVFGESKQDYIDRIYDDWNKYISPFEYLCGFEKVNLDLVMIDGRSRTSCALSIFKYLNDDSILMIHDTYGRDYYKYMKDFYFVYDSNFSFEGGTIESHYEQIKRNEKGAIINPNRGFVALKKKKVSPPEDNFIKDIGLNWLG